MIKHVRCSVQLEGGNIVSLTFLVGFLIVIFVLYHRYVPVRGIRCMSKKRVNSSDFKIVDVRDYTQSYADSIDGAVNIPLAYLKREYEELEKENIVIVASNHVEKNISTRFLTKKGVHVVGYMITESSCYETAVSN